MDVWRSADLNLGPDYEKGERSIMSRRCRFPGFHTPTADLDGATYIVTVMTEYFSTD